MGAPRGLLILALGAGLAVTLGSSTARGQDVAPRPIDEVEPDLAPTPVTETPEEPEEPEPATAKAPKAPAPKAAPDAGSVAARIVPPVAAPVAATVAAPVGVARPAAKADAGVPVAGPPPTPKTLQLPTTDDAQLTDAWVRWRKAQAAQNLGASSAARLEIARLRDEQGLSSLESFSVGFVRAAEARQRSNDAAGAVELASAAVDLSPDLPYAHLGLAGAYFFADATDVARVATELVTSLRRLFGDPRYLRSVEADLGAAFLLTFLATAAVVTLVLFGRRVRYLAHDVHHLFPSAVAPWQSAAALALLLTLPVTLRLGLVAVLGVPLVSVAFYLSFRERLVGAIALGLLAGMPYGAGFLARQTAFAGTLADDVFALEGGGYGADEALQHIERRVAEERAGFVELFSLGRYELRHGKVKAALAHIQTAIASHPGDSRAMVALGNAMAANGDVDGALVIYESAAKADPSLAAAPYNLGRLLELRASGMRPDAAAGEVDRAQTALARSRDLDPSLSARKELEGNPPLNKLLLAPGPLLADITALADPGAAPEKVQVQVGRQLLGDLELPLGAVLPLALGLALVAVGRVRGWVGASRVCSKCGRAVCRRCDPELGLGSEMCHQCVNVFVRRGVVPPPVKIRKQLEIERHQSRVDKLGLALGFLCSGAGHLFVGLPVRGAFYAFGFLFAVVMVFFRNGVLRAPYGDPAYFFRLGALGVVFLLFYLLPLRGLYKRQVP